ncbi:hypothetical protein GCM10023191_083680 [Actinoallomurus oryzae]|uniref:Uncharacterized protein n=2 Tax=Actinoallomurus oryzae TaxID=502180 RepID=A0ABP8R0N2_9ACTN
MDYGRADAEPERASAVDWARVAKRAIRLIAIHHAIAGIGLFALVVREATTVRHFTDPPPPSAGVTSSASPHPATAHRHL